MPKQRQAEPVRRRAIAAEQSGSAEHQRTGADGGDVLRLSGLAAQKAEHNLVVHQGLLPGAARNHDHIERRAVRAGDGRDEDQPAIGSHRIGGLGDDMNAGVRKPGENFVGTGEIDLRHLRKQQ